MIVEWPVVTRDVIVSALRGGTARTPDAVLRTARKRGLLGSGYSSWISDRGSLHGRAALWSSLSVDAARCSRRGLPRHAQLLAAAARKLESGLEMEIIGNELWRLSSPVGSISEGYPRTQMSAEWNLGLFGPFRDAMKKLALQEHKWRAKVDEPGVTRVGARVNASARGSISLESEDGQAFALAHLSEEGEQLQLGQLVIITSFPLEFSNWSVAISPGWQLDGADPFVFKPFAASVPGGRAASVVDEILSLTPVPLEA